MDKVEESNELKSYRRKIVILGVVSTPFFIAFALSSLAYFKGNAVISLLENKEVAFAVFIVSLIAVVIELALQGYYVYQIRELELQEQNT